MRIHCLVFGYKRVISFLQSNRLFSPMSPTYAHLCHANRAAFGRKTAYVSASCLVAFLSNLALTKSCVFRVHITQGHGRNRRFSWQKRTQVEDLSLIHIYTSVETIFGIIADECAIGMINSKTTAVRLIPAIGKTVGDQLDFGGLLGYAPVSYTHLDVYKRQVQSLISVSVLM